jgi:hypothetical protein
LHTLRGVSFSDVPAAAIAAALPRLQTLHVNNADANFAVSAFYDELLPRLRSFRLVGAWPETSDTTMAADVVPLPLLEDLKWPDGDVHLSRGFMAARPSMLNISNATLVEWLKAADDADPGLLTATSPLVRVRTLTLRFEETDPVAATLARLLRAAPHLRQLTFNVDSRDRLRWVLSEGLSPVFAGLVHPRLRHVAIIGQRPPLDVSDGCGVRLREHHFPRLRRLTVAEEEHPV